MIILYMDRNEFKACFKNYMVKDDLSFIKLRNYVRQLIDNLDLKESYKFIKRLHNKIGCDWEFQVLSEYAYNVDRIIRLNNVNIQVVNQYNYPRTRDEFDVLDSEGLDLKVLDKDSRIRYIQCKSSFQNFDTVTFDQKMILEPLPYYLLHHQIIDFVPKKVILINWHDVCDEIYDCYKVLNGFVKNKRPGRCKLLNVRFSNSKPFFFINYEDISSLTSKFEVLEIS